MNVIELNVQLLEIKCLRNNQHILGMTEGD